MTPRPDPAAPSAEPPRPHVGLGSMAIFVLAAAAVVAAGFWLAPHVTRERVEGWIRAAGAWGPLVLFGVQVAQILAAPIPGLFVPVLAGVLYGPVLGPLLTALGTLVGSTIAYWLGRRAGRPLSERWIGSAPIEKAAALMRGKRWIALVPLFLIPLSPSDALCFMAGILAMDWGRFTIAVALGRLPKDALVALGSALGWGAILGP